MITLFNSLDAQVQSNDDNITADLTGGTTSFSFTLPAGNKRLIVVCITGALDITAVTFNSLALTSAVEASAGGLRSELWYREMGDGTEVMANVAITATASGSLSLVGTVANSYHNVQQGGGSIDDTNTDTRVSVPGSSFSIDITSPTDDMACDCLHWFRNGGNFSGMSLTGTGTEHGEIEHLNWLGTGDSMTGMSRKPGSGTTAMSWTSSHQATHYAHAGMNINSAGVFLPVELVSFDAHRTDRSVKLDWQTASETNNAGFEVQRSTDGKNFQNLSFIEGNGTTTEQQNYVYDDRDLKKGQRYYYRLKQIDYDGKFEYSNIINARLESDQISGTFSPNPVVDGQTRLDYITMETGTLNLRIFDVSGKELMQLEESVQKGDNRFDLDLTALGVGMFFVKMEQGGMSGYEKLVMK